MPIAVLYVRNIAYIVEKVAIEDGEEYESLMSLIEGKIAVSQKPTTFVRKEHFTSLLEIAENEAEREKLKHAVCVSQNLSARDASKHYGIREIKQRSEKVLTSQRTVQDIKRYVQAMARVEQKTCEGDHLVENKLGILNRIKTRISG